MCHDERFLNLWIKDCPFTLNYITDLPRYVDQEHCQTTFDDKSGYDHIHPSSITYFGLEWGDGTSRTPHFPSAGKHTVGMASTHFIRSNGVPCSQYIDDRHTVQLRPPRVCVNQFSNFQLPQMAAFVACSVLISLGYLTPCTFGPVFGLFV